MNDTATSIAEEIGSRWKPYPVYKDSDVEWLGEIPEHWEIKQLKYVVQGGLTNGLFKKKDQFGSGVKLVNVVDVYQNSFVIDFKSLERVETEQQELETYMVYPGDIYFVRSSLKLEGVGASVCITEVPEPTVFECHLIRIRPRQNHVIPKYLINCLNSSLARQRLVALAETTTMTTIAQPKLASLDVTVPPISEQYTIASFLDHETTHIDTLIAKKERLIDLLVEKRSALISQAVTKGLDPTVPMKDSGVEWLGEIPAHWDVMTLRRVISSIEQGWSPSCENRIAEGAEWGVLKAGCVNRGVFNALEHKALPSNLEPLPSLEVRPGDVLMSRASGSSELVGSVAYVESCRERLLLSDKIFRLHVNPARIRPIYLSIVLNSRGLRIQIEQSISGAEGLANNIPQSTVKDFSIGLPPFEEQEAITRFIDSETSKIDALISKVRKHIEKLKEYRTALISAAVTGKIDVREEVT